MAKIKGGLQQEVERLSTKYREMLCVSCPTPEFQVVDHLGSKWHGIAKWSATRPNHTLIQFQKRIVDDPRTFERIFAHEFIHHVNYQNITAKDIAYLRAGIKVDGHGEEFLKLAAVVNQHMGKDFVTPTSDFTYAVSESGKTIVLYIGKLGLRSNPRFGWAWAQRLTPRMQSWLEGRLKYNDFRLVLVKDDRWTAGPRIGTGKISIPKAPEDIAKLRELYSSPEETKLDTIGLFPQDVLRMKALFRRPEPPASAAA
jgi:hypothetical protein